MDLYLLVVAQQLKRRSLLTGVRGLVDRWRRWRRWQRLLGSVRGRTCASRASRRRGRIFRGAGDAAGRAGGSAQRDQPQQRHAPPPEHGGQRAGNAPDAARGLLATEIRAPWGPPRSGTRQVAGLRDAGARAQPHGDCGAASDGARPRPNTISGATLRAALPARRALPILREIAGGR